MSANKWMYALVVVVSIAAGVLIAGGPSSLRSREAVSTAGALDAGTTTTTAAEVAITTTVPDVAITPDAGTTISPTSAAPTSTAQPESTTTVPGRSDGPQSKDQLEVAVANGSGYPGLAGSTAAELIGLGYTRADAVDTDRTHTSEVYALPGLDAEAVELALDAGLAATDVMAMDAVPALSVPNTFDLVLVLGTDAVPADG